MATKDRRRSQNGFPSPRGEGKPQGRLTALVIADLYRAACLAELDALKVGNVHAYAAGHRMEVADFVTSAEVSAPRLAGQGASVGERIRGGVEATIAAVGQNTNLGILLLCAPLALTAEGPNDLRSGLGHVLNALDEADGAAVFEAIRRANPGGLGKAERHDVTADAPPVTLRAAMAEAAGRDRIARAYVTGFADLFEVGLTALGAARAQDLDAPWTATAVHLAFLCRIPDSHIARKHGPETAEAVRQETAATLGPLDLRARPVEALLAYDRRLKAAGINPGTSADFTVATLFADALLAARGEGPAGKGPRNETARHERFRLPCAGRAKNYRFQSLARVVRCGGSLYGPRRCPG